MATIVSYLSNHFIELPAPEEPAFFFHGKMDPKATVQESSSSQSINSSTPLTINDMSISEIIPR
ncbi:putative cysteine-rich receptor-like protein kinase 31 [Sesbania bispinosa]|nr:putative cysteine-rich receptor-like protein kinase 31 [Sesbania bispinosa]